MNGTNGGLRKLMEEVVRFHGHLCGEQILGIRMALAGLRELNINDPRGEEGRDLVIFVETDRCPTDAIVAVTGRTPGKRGIKMMDYGKMAATFIDTRSGRAVRVSAKGNYLERVERIAQSYIPQKDVKQANLAALMAISEEDLLGIQRVSVQMRPQDLPGEPLDTVICRKCGEMVKDARQVVLDGKVLCKPCARGSDYYTVVEDSLPEPGLEGFIESKISEKRRLGIH